VIPALGGPEQKLAEVSIPQIQWMSGPYLAWTADSHSLILPDRPNPDKPTALFVLPVQTGDKRQITFPPDGIVGDACASLSPDGQTLAFCRCSRLGDWFIDLYTIALTANLAPQNEVKRLTSDKFRLTGLAWTSPGTEIIFGAITEYGNATLWRLPVSKSSGAAATELPISDARSPTTSSHSSRLAFSRLAGGDIGILRLQNPVAGKAADPAVPFLASTRDEFAPRYSPNGKRIAFESTRGGRLQIWTCGSTGEECLQLTSMSAEFTGLPNWSPDGKQITFYSRVQNKSQIFVIGANGTGLRQITTGDSNNFIPSWSRDGRSIYFSSNRSGTTQLWKVPTEGGSPVQVTHSGGFASRESPDGQSLYFTKTDSQDTSLWKLSLSSGEETQVLPSVHLYNFDPTEDGVYFLENASTLKHNAAGQVVTVAPQLPEGYVGLSVSPDKTSILFTAYKSKTSELVMIEDFH
jgi:Tol biopolymer transport system component